jgi:hypothetical protein
MVMRSCFKEMEDTNAVVSMNTGTFKLFDLLEFIGYFLNFTGFNQLLESIGKKGKGNIPNSSEIFRGGVPVELLEPGSSQWIKGKMRLRLVIEFCPDQSKSEPLEISKPEGLPVISSLDEIRQIVSNGSNLNGES